VTDPIDILKSAVFLRKKESVMVILDFVSIWKTAFLFARFEENVEERIVVEFWLVRARTPMSLEARLLVKKVDFIRVWLARTE